VAIWDQAGSHPRPARIHLLPLPAYSPDLNPVEVIGDVIKDRIASTPWHTLESLEEALGEEPASRPRNRRARAKVGFTSSASELANATATENTAIAR